MSFLRSLRAYIGLGPDDELEGLYLDELNARRRELELDAIYPDRRYSQEERAERRARMSYQSRRQDDAYDHGDDDGADDGEIVDRRDRDRGRRGRRQRSSEEHVGSQRERAVSRREVVSDWGGASPFGDTDGLDAAFIDGLADEDQYSDAGYVDESAHYPDEIDLREDDGIPASPFDEIHLDTIEPEEVASDDGSGAVVHSLDVMRAKPKTVLPESFADAKEIADEFRREIPIVLNLQGQERELARRMIDFASGVCYVLDGSMEKIASQVFLLVPEGVDVSPGDRRLIEERGYAR